MPTTTPEPENTRPADPATGPTATAASGQLTRRSWIVLAIALVLAIATIVITQPWNGLLAEAGPTGTPSADPGASGEPLETPPPPDPVEPAEPTSVPIDSPAPIATEVVASISKMEAVEGEAKGPGEVAGPSVRFTVTIRNDTDAEVDLSSAVITADYGSDRTPALQLFEPGGKNLPASVAAGESVKGVYIFSIPVEKRDRVRVTLDYSVGVPPLEFTGAAPRPKK